MITSFEFFVRQKFVAAENGELDVLIKQQVQLGKWVLPKNKSQMCVFGYTAGMFNSNNYLYLE